MWVLLQTFCFHDDFIEALNVGYARKAEPRRRRGEKRKGKIFPSDRMRPHRCCSSLSDLYIPHSQHPGNGVQLILAHHESVKSELSVVSVTSSAKTGSFWNNFALEKTMTDLAGSVLQKPLTSQHFSFLNVCFSHLGFSHLSTVSGISLRGHTRLERSRDGKPELADRAWWQRFGSVPVSSTMVPGQEC